MKKIALVLYTITCLALGSLLFQGETNASGYLSTEHYSAYPLGAPSGYQACLGVSFKNGIKKDKVLVDWKSDHNFVVYIKE